MKIVLNRNEFKLVKEIIYTGCEVAKAEGIEVPVEMFVNNVVISRPGSVLSIIKGEVTLEFSLEMMTDIAGWMCDFIKTVGPKAIKIAVLMDQLGPDMRAMMESFTTMANRYQGEAIVTELE